MPQPPKTLNEFSSLVQATSDLRGPEGCPWDKEQTHESLIPYAIEEVYEMVDALESKDDHDFCDELGDVLFQVVIHAELAKERGAFDIHDVIQAITSKIVRRHPHVFSDVKVNGTKDVLKNWEEIKKNEKEMRSAKKKTESLISSKSSALAIPSQLPALQAAEKIGQKTKKYKFDWHQATEVLEKLKSEVQELEQAMQNQNSDECTHELGDVLFSAAQLGRHLNIDPEQALRKGNQRFIKRFEAMLAICGKSADEFSLLPYSEKESLWIQAKTKVG